MSILCWFMPCRWIYICNAERWFETSGKTHLCGIYQCAICRDVSIGSPKPFANEVPGADAP